AVRQSPTNPRLYLNLSNILAAAGKFAKAEAAIRHAHDLAPLDPVPLVNLGDLLQRLGDGPGALEHYEQALQLNPQSPSLLRKMLAVYDGLVEPDMERIARLKEQLDLAGSQP
ncbi:tetratricopeptide repeat protein, partial [bacterium]|nr:tetratricopeptide repeat protein [candidate division CSSED10-310 bacterium]